MVGAIEQEFRATGDGAELADNEPVPELRIVEQDVVLFKPRRVHRIVVVGVIPDLDVRGRHHIFDIAGCAVFVWKNRVGVRKPHAADGLIHDVSSCFLSEPVNVSDYGIIYGGVQKNIGPAGMVISIIRDDLITDDVLPGTPTMMKFKTHADAGSLYNTPNCYCIYMCGKVFKWLKKMGGLEVMKQRNEEKAKLLYDFLDQSKLFKGTVVLEDRSLMNVPFITGNADLDAKFVKESKEAGLENLKGHRTVGGMRASIYNAMPKKGVETLVAFMKKFEEENL